MISERENQQPVGRVSPQGDTRSLAEANADVGLRCANPTYEAIQANDWKQLAGALKNSPNLNGDPLLIQREMRHDFP
jgi:hypothetical protein